MSILKNAKNQAFRELRRKFTWRHALRHCGASLPSCKVRSGRPSMERRQQCWHDQFRAILSCLLVWQLGRLERGNLFEYVITLYFEPRTFSHILQLKGTIFDGWLRACCDDPISWSLSIQVQIRLAGWDWGMSLIECSDWKVWRVDPDETQVKDEAGNTNNLLEVPAN